MLFDVIVFVYFLLSLSPLKDTSLRELYNNYHLIVLTLIVLKFYFNIIKIIMNNISHSNATKVGDDDEK